jgi:hypothetical protein
MSGRKEMERSSLVIALDVWINNRDHLSPMSADALLHVQWGWECSRVPSKVSLAVSVFNILEQTKRQTDR